MGHEHEPREPWTQRAVQVRGFYMRLCMQQVRRIGIGKGEGRGYFGMVWISQRGASVAARPRQAPPGPTSHTLATEPDGTGGKKKDSRGSATRRREGRIGEEEKDSLVETGRRCQTKSKIITCISSPKITLSATVLFLLGVMLQSLSGVTHAGSTPCMPVWYMQVPNGANEFHQHIGHRLSVISEGQMEMTPLNKIEDVDTGSFRTETNSSQAP